MDHWMHLVSTVPSKSDGVTDYALNLAYFLHTHHGISNRLATSGFNAKNITGNGRKSVEIMEVHPNNQLFKLLDEQNPSALVLHYVGYAYSRRGVPLWLYSALKKWSAAGGRVIANYHEIWSSGPPWKSVFYLHPLQKWIAKEIAKISCQSITSTLTMKRLMEKASSKQLALIPIPSNVVTDAQRISLSSPKNPPWTIVIFGKRHSRLRTIKQHGKLLQTLHREQLLQKVIIVGEGASPGRDGSDDIQSCLEYLPEDKLDIRGFGSPDEIVSAFVEADMLFSFYPAYLACKSAVIMTSLACGCPVVLSDEDDAAPLQAESHFIGCDGSERQISRLIKLSKSGVLERIGRAGRDWYLAHADWPVVASKFAEASLKSIKR